MTSLGRLLFSENLGLGRQNKCLRSKKKKAVSHLRVLKQAFIVFKDDGKVVYRSNDEVRQSYNLYDSFFIAILISITEY